MFEVNMMCTINGESVTFNDFPTRKDAETFVENSKKSDRNAEKSSWFVYAIEESS